MELRNRYVHALCQTAMRCVLIFLYNSMVMRRFCCNDLCFDYLKVVLYLKMQSSKVRIVSHELVHITIIPTGKLNFLI